MERARWTDEWIDERMAAIGVGVHRQLVLALTAFGVGVLGLLGAQTF